jgi:hypothetical protein
MSSKNNEDLIEDPEIILNSKPSPRKPLLPSQLRQSLYPNRISLF